MLKSRNGKAQYFLVFICTLFPFYLSNFNSFLPYYSHQQQTPLISHTRNLHPQNISNNHYNPYTSKPVHYSNSKYLKTMKNKNAEYRQTGNHNQIPAKQYRDIKPRFAKNKGSGFTGFRSVYGNSNVNRPRVFNNYSNNDYSNRKKSNYKSQHQRPNSFMSVYDKPRIKKAIRIKETPYFKKNQESQYTTKETTTKTNNYPLERESNKKDTWGYTNQNQNRHRTKIKEVKTSGTCESGPSKIKSKKKKHKAVKSEIKDNSLHMKYIPRKVLKISKIMVDGNLLISSFGQATGNIVVNKYDTRATLKGNGLKTVGLTGKFEIKT